MANEKTHFLWHGLAVCGLRGLPSEWPEGHKWVSLNDREHIHHVDCEGCLRAVHNVAGVKYISPSAREYRCPACGLQVFADDELRTIHHEAPVCAEFLKRAAGATRSITTLDTEKRN